MLTQRGWHTSRPSYSFPVCIPKTDRLYFPILILRFLKCCSLQRPPVFVFCESLQKKYRDSSSTRPGSLTPKPVSQSPFISYPSLRGNQILAALCNILHSTSDVFMEIYLEQNDTLRRLYFKFVKTVAFTDSLQNYSNNKTNKFTNIKIIFFTHNLS